MSDGLLLLDSFEFVPRSMSHHHHHHHNHNQSMDQLSDSSTSSSCENIGPLSHLQQLQQLNQHQAQLPQSYPRFVNAQPHLHPQVPPQQDPMFQLQYQPQPQQQIHSYEIQDFSSAPYTPEFVPQVPQVPIQPELPPQPQQQQQYAYMDDTSTQSPAFIADSSMRVVEQQQQPSYVQWQASPIDEHVHVYPPSQIPTSQPSFALTSSTPYSYDISSSAQQLPIQQVPPPPPAIQAPSIAPPDQQHYYEYPPSYSESQHDDPVSPASSSSSSSSHHGSSSSSSVRKAIIGADRGEKRYQCTICGKYFRRDLPRHMRTHEDQARFACPFPRNHCSHKRGQFNRPYDFKKHLLHGHFIFDDPKVRGYKDLKSKLEAHGCCTCGQRFQADDWINVHIMGDQDHLKCPNLFDDQSS